jgi:uncharacterized membrane protein (UPF0127 family)
VEGLLIHTNLGIYLDMIFVDFHGVIMRWIML